MKATTPKARWRQLLAAAALLTAAAVLAYWPALTGGFVWDDDTLLTDSRLVKAADGLYRMWFTTEPLDYWPMTNSSFWLEWRLWGLHPAGYHLTNLLLHVCSGLLVWAILKRLAIPGALLAACLFILHPVNVESVAWIAQRKNTLSMLFLLLSILWYLRFDGEPSVAAAAPVPPPRRKARPADPSPPRSLPVAVYYWLSLAAFVLAMLSKGSVAILPGVLLLIAWWRRDRLTKTDLVRVLPFFVVAVALTVLNIWFQAHLMTGVIRDVTPLQRALGAGAVVWFYLWKALVPMRLVFVYPQWSIHGDELRWWLPLIAAVATTMLLIWQRRRPAVRAVLFAWLFFGLALLPVMGLTDVYYMRYSLVADHYQYIAILAVVAAVAAGLSHLATLTGAPSSELVQGAPVRTGRALDRLGFGRPVAGALWRGLLLAVLGTATFRQSRQYADAETLYRTTLASNPSSWLIHNLLGVHLVARSVDDAILHFREAVRLKPDLLEAHNNLCQATLRVGRAREAAAECAEALRINPNTPSAHNGLGEALASLGQPVQAQTEFEAALGLEPRYAEAQANLADLLVATDRPAEAIDHYRQALALTPHRSDARRNLGIALESQGRTGEAIDQYREALRLDPSLADVRVRLDMLLKQSGVTDAIARMREELRLHPDRTRLHASLAEALLDAGRAREAVGEFNNALISMPDAPAVHVGLAIALADAGQTADAEKHLREAIRLKPDLAEAHRHLADLLVGRGLLQDAVAEYSQALASEPRSAEAHNNMGVALVRLGRIDDAVEHFKTATTIDPEYADARTNLNKTLNARGR